MLGLNSETRKPVCVICCWFWSPAPFYDAVGSTNNTIKIFTAEEGGAEHAHVDNRQIGIDFAADWLEDNM